MLHSLRQERWLILFLYLSKIDTVRRLYDFRSLFIIRQELSRILVDCQYVASVIRQGHHFIHPHIWAILFLFYFKLRWWRLLSHSIRKVQRNFSTLPLNSGFRILFRNQLEYFAWYWRIRIKTELFRIKVIICLWVKLFIISNACELLKGQDVLWICWIFVLRRICAFIESQPIQLRLTICVQQGPSRPYHRPLSGKESASRVLRHVHFAFHSDLFGLVPYLLLFFLCEVPELRLNWRHHR